MFGPYFGALLKYLGYPGQTLKPPKLHASFQLTLRLSLPWCLPIPQILSSSAVNHVTDLLPNLNTSCQFTPCLCRFSAICVPIQPNGGPCLKNEHCISGSCLLPVCAPFGWSDIAAAVQHYALEFEKDLEIGALNVKNLAIGVSADVKDTAIGVSNDVVSMANKVGSAVNFASTYVPADKIKSVAVTITGELINSISNDATKYAKSVAKTVKKTAEKVWHAAQEALEDAWDSISGWFG